MDLQPVASGLEMRSTLLSWKLKFRARGDIPQMPWTFRLTSLSLWPSQVCMSMSPISQGGQAPIETHFKFFELSICRSFLNMQMGTFSRTHSQWNLIYAWTPLDGKPPQSNHCKDICSLHSWANHVTRNIARSSIRHDLMVQLKSLKRLTVYDSKYKPLETTTCGSSRADGAEIQLASRFALLQDDVSDQEVQIFPYFGLSSSLLRLCSGLICMSKFFLIFHPLLAF